MKFLDPESEPVRRWAWGIAGAVIALAVVFGWATGEQAAAIGAVVTAALGLPVAEAVRAKVKPANGSTEDTSHAELEE